MRILESSDVLTDKKYENDIIIVNDRDTRKRHLDILGRNLSSFSIIKSAAWVFFVLLTFDKQKRTHY